MYDLNKLFVCNKKYTIEDVISILCNIGIKREEIRITDNKIFINGTNSVIKYVRDYSRRDEVYIINIYNPQKEIPCTNINNARSFPIKNWNYNW